MKKGIIYQAVVFDLFGTLIDNFSTSEYKSILSEMAQLLDAPPNLFIQLWFDTFKKRCIGDFKNVDENISYVCRKLNLNPIISKIKDAAQIRFSFTQKSITPKEEAIETLNYIRHQGLKTALITDCSIETPTILENTPFKKLFDVCIFSCIVGVKKPDEKIYEIACSELSISTDKCLYVGDGSSNELFGAEQVGMHPILLQDPKEQDAHRIDEEPWHGQKIEKLSELRNYI